MRVSAQAQRRQNDENDENDENGFTLVELLVAAVVMIVVLTIVGSLMISTITTERAVRTVNTATTAGQLVLNSVETKIQNSSIRDSTTPFDLPTMTGSDQLLVARTAGSGTTLTWSCTAWYYSAASKTIRVTSSASAITPRPTTEPLTWTLLSVGVSPLVGSKVFVKNGMALTVAFNQDAGKNSPILFQRSISSQTGVTGSSPCF